jgi:chemotaxis protein MotB
MKKTVLFLLCVSLGLSSCISKKQFAGLQTELEVANKDLGKCGESLNDYMNRLTACEKENERLKGELKANVSTMQLRQEQIEDLREQITDARSVRDNTVTQVGDLTVLTQEANKNVEATLKQLERKDKYINLLQAAKTKADSINLALAVNLKDVLREGIADQDVDIKVDKTVVFINISDKMLYESGSHRLSPRANEVLGKIAKIVQSRPELEVMVEGYTDNVPMRSSCIEDNWDLSVKRSTSVVRALQTKYGVNPNKLIAAGRGEYNTLASNDTADGKSMNRRTRIILLPKLDQFYDLLNPNNIPE